MTHELDDPILTAYALDELDRAERAAVEARLADSAEARAWVDEIRATARRLEAGLKAEPAPELTPAQRTAIECRLQVQPRRGLRWRVIGYAAAACLVLGAASIVTVHSLGRRASETFGTVAGRIALADRQGTVLPRSETVVEELAVGKPVTSLTAVDELRQTGAARRLPENSPVPAAPAAAPAGGANFSIALGRKRYLAAGADRAGAAGEHQLVQLQAGGGQAQRGLEERAATDLFELEKRGREAEAYQQIADNPFLAVAQNPRSTFSIDVDTGAYANVRRFLNQNSLPPKDAVRIEELVNYFAYDDPPPTGDDPFSVNLEIAQCPWKPAHRLVRIGLKGKPIANDQRPASNLVFLIDVSGSMDSHDKLPLAKRGLELLVRNLTENDRVAIAVYAGASGLVLPSTPGTSKETILEALERLQAGGSTNGGAGIELAYAVATDNFIKGGVNRVLLLSDGDFNVGVTNRGDLVRLIEQKAKSGVYLSVLGFGTGNVKDATMEQLADKGNGNYAYVDRLQEARKVLVEQMGSTLVTIAKDVKLQVEFNPAKVAAYRLIGYENRLLRHEDFNDDTKDAGEIGAGHNVTALYELVPVGVKIDLPTVDELKFQKPVALADAAQGDELMAVKLRYKQPDGETSKLIARGVVDSGRTYAQASADYKFAAAVASFGMLLRASPYRGNASFDSVLELAREAIGTDATGWRREFVELVKKASTLRLGGGQDRR